ncbi:hypothetical protein [Longirhabdus pacifica]|uniref:hypothetical protein n=1 Tax=Longirhabdus pacifica TaxID=2305227 RepID=UPI0010090820|nr:hypothetical protein [Longirhabdus pacifica]
MKKVLISIVAIALVLGISVSAISASSFEKDAASSKRIVYYSKQDYPNWWTDVPRVIGGPLYLSECFSASGNKWRCIYYGGYIP